MLVSVLGLSLAVAAVELPPDEITVAVKIEAGASFGGLMARFGLQERPIREAAAAYVDLTRIRPGRQLQLVWRGDEVVAVRYQLDEDRTVVVASGPTGWSADVELVPFASDVRALSVTIEGSVWATLVREAGLRDGDIARVNAVLEYAVDLNTEVHPGDTLTLVGDVRSLPGRSPWLGDLHAVRFVGKARTIEAVRFVHPDGTEDWYAPDGTSQKGAFLRSPLEFSSVSSGFSRRRFHPILKINRPHNGTDLAAATGTPVRSVADGVVVKAGWNGGHGNYVEIRHDDVWTTSYSHLSKVLVRTGQKVQQGTYVGKVGATGTATGAHLHYQMWRRGQFVDAMKVELPLAHTLAPAEEPVLAALVALYQPLLDNPALATLRGFQPTW